MDIRLFIFVDVTDSDSKSGSTGLIVHLKAAQSANGVKQAYIIIAVAAYDTKWKL